MKKSELRTGMVVESRTGHRGLVMLNITKEGDNRVVGTGANRETWFPLTQLQEDLKSSIGEGQYDIVKVYSAQNDNMTLGTTSIITRELIYSEEAPVFEEGEVVRIVKGGNNAEEVDGALGMVHHIKTKVERGQVNNPTVVVKVGKTLWGLGDGYELETIE